MSSNWISSYSFYIFTLFRGFDNPSIKLIIYFLSSSFLLTFIFKYYLTPDLIDYFFIRKVLELAILSTMVSSSSLGWEAITSWIFFVRSGLILSILLTVDTMLIITPHFINMNFIKSENRSILSNVNQMKINCNRMINICYYVVKWINITCLIFFQNIQFISFPFSVFVPTIVFFQQNLFFSWALPWNRLSTTWNMLDFPLFQVRHFSLEYAQILIFHFTLLFQASLLIYVPVFYGAFQTFINYL